jgi:hypothetical protein
VSDLGPDLGRKLRAFQELHRVTGAALADLIAALPKETPAAPGPGRPPVRATPEQTAEILRLHSTNGRLSRREIGRRVDLPRRTVDRVLKEHAVAQNSPWLARNPSPIELDEIP